jgi:hypothetical protein
VRRQKVNHCVLSFCPSDYNFISIYIYIKGLRSEGQTCSEPEGQKVRETRSRR